MHANSRAREFVIQKFQRRIAPHADARLMDFLESLQREARRAGHLMEQLGL